MYQLSVSAFGDFTRYELEHPESGNRFSIVPERGANVLDLHFGGVNILDGYDTPEALEQAKWGKSVLLFPFPNRLDRGQYSWQGKTYQFPINNAATENAIHGFVRDEAFYVVKIELGLEYALIQCRFDYDGSRPYYPFPFTLDVTFKIQNNGQFALKTSCLNRHSAPIPIGFGWHPYFKLTEKSDAHQMRLPVSSMVEINERMIPTGAQTHYTHFYRRKLVADTFLDNCFQAGTHGTYKMLLEHGTQNLIVSANAGQFPFFQVFTPPHRESIALEPMSCNVDALNNGDGLDILHPQETWKGEIKLKYSNIQQ